MEDFEHKPKPRRKHKRKANEVAEETAILPSSDTSSASTKGQIEAVGVKVEKKSGEPTASRPRKKKNVKQRAEASAQTLGVELATVQMAPATPHPTISEPPQREATSTMTPEPLKKVANETVNKAEKVKEAHSIRERILQRLFKGVVWTVQVCSGAIITILLGFSQPAPDIPILNFIERHKLTVLIVVCVVVFLTSVVIIALPSLYKFLRPMDARLKTMGVVTSVSILSCTLCLSLLGITLARPSWCPTSLCPAPQPLIAKGGVHDNNLQVTFQTLQSSIKVIPDAPSTYTLGNLPTVGDAQLIDTSQVLPYRVVLKIHSLQQGRYGLVIDRVTLVVNKQAQEIPYPLRVWIANNGVTYNNNLYRVTYRGQGVHAVLYALSTQPYGIVQLLPGETDELSLEVRSTVVADLHFQVQVTYHVIGELASQTLTFPSVFEIIFSDLANWQPYQFQGGHLETTS